MRPILDMKSKKHNFSVLPRINKNPTYKLNVRDKSYDSIEKSLEIKNKKRLDPIDKLSALAMKKNIQSKTKPKRSLN